MNETPSDDDQYPDDLEVYVEGEPLEALQEWLMAALPGSELRNTSKKGFRINGLYNNAATPITVVKNAGNTGFTSVWIQSLNAPWDNDISLAKQLHKDLKVTVRCNASPWQNGDDPDEWYEISSKGESSVHWPTA